MANETTRTPAEFEVALAAFVAKCQERENAHIAANFKLLTPSKFSTSVGGKRFVRVVKADADGTSRSVFCFVERGTGNIFKPAGWKAPTLNHVRGNIFADDALAGTNVYGTNYVGAAAAYNYPA